MWPIAGPAATASPTSRFLSRFLGNNSGHGNDADIPQLANMTCSRRKRCCGGQSMIYKSRLGTRLCEDNDCRQESQGATGHPQQSVTVRKEKHPQAWAKYE